MVSFFDVSNRLKILLTGSHVFKDCENSGSKVSKFVIGSGDQDKSMFDFRNWQDPGPSVKCHPLHDFCGLPKRDFIISAVMTPS